jgi:aromatic-L-amino-acid decarboxylase
MLNREDYLQEMQKVSAWIARYFDSIKNLPVKSQVAPGDVFSQFEDIMPIQGTTTEVILEEITEKILPGITHWQHPNFHAYFPANSSVESVLAETITAGIGAQCMMWVTSPAAAELEEKVLGWLRDKMGIPGSWQGVIQDTASTATLAAVLTAREKTTGFTSNKNGVPSGLVAYCSMESHSSIEKAVAIAGIGTNNLRKISTNPDLSMNVEDLRKTIINDLNSGYKPFCVVSALGSTGTVAMDSVGCISAICNEYDIWHHIDAAYAGSALLLEEYQYLINGIEKADSFVFNPHKWLFTNFDCSAYYVKNADLLVKTFEAIPEYLKTNIPSDINNYKDWGVPMGRRFRALKLWWVIKSYGLENIQKTLRNHIDLATYFCDKIGQVPEIELLTKPILNFCFLRWKPLKITDENLVNVLNSDLVDKINRSGKLFISHTKVEGRYGIRFVFGQTYLTKQDVELAYKTLTETINEMKTLVS